MLHVFVETNWVVAFAAPAHHKVTAAIKLLERAGSGDLRLHLPSICLAEARYPLRSRYQPRHPDEIRKFLRWARVRGTVSEDDDAAARRVLEQFEREVRSELDHLDASLKSLWQAAGLEIFPLDEAMLQRTTDLAFQNLSLKPYDQAILAAVLVRAEVLARRGGDEVAFCELDADLQPWDKDFHAKQPLTTLYDERGIWVYGDFALEYPKRPAGWPAPKRA